MQILIFGIFKCSVSSVALSCLTLCDPMDCSSPDFPVHHELPELTQAHVHWVSDVIHPSHPLSSPSPAAFNQSQYQGLFKWVSYPHQVAKVLEFQFQHQSFQTTGGKNSNCWLILHYSVTLIGKQVRHKYFYT